MEPELVAVLKQPQNMQEW